MRFALPLFALLAACAAGPAVAPTATAERRAIVVSIDGLMPEAVLDPDAHGLRIPNLRALAAGGLVARPGATPVFPTVTYPNHTSMATGVFPARHGITSNVVFDPEMKNQEGWYWYASDIRARTVWDAAAARGLRTALVGWPVTVGAKAAALLPEIWRAGTPDDVKLVAALATPGLLDQVTARFPDFRAGYTPPETKDRAVVDAAVVVLETIRPQLMLLHIFGTDDAQHAAGPWSPEAIAAIEEADTQLGRVLAAAGALDRTLVVIVSDHGFQAYSRTLRPGTLLRAAGLVEVDAASKVVAWRAGVATNGGSAFVYARDAASAERARAALAGVEGIGKFFTPEELRARGADPAAAFAVEAADGWAFLGGVLGDAVAPAPGRGTHGYDDRSPRMRATLLVRAPGVAPGSLDGARLVDVAPTVAAWLGLDLPGVDGRSLLPR